MVFGHLLPIFCGHLVPIFCGHLVYFVVIWYIFPRFVMMYQEKSGNPAEEDLFYRGRTDKERKILKMRRIERQTN
jgi:hypothetical protein